MLSEELYRIQARAAARSAPPAAAAATKRARAPLRAARRAQNARSSELSAEAVGDDVHHWRVSLGAFDASSPLGRDLQARAPAPPPGPPRRHVAP